jgi:hypothetical protein
MKLQLLKFYSVKDVQGLFFPSRSERWVKDTFKAGAYGQVLRDGAGWMISEQAVARFQEVHLVGSVPAAGAGACARPMVRRGQLENLVQVLAAGDVGCGG